MNTLPKRCAGILLAVPFSLSAQNYAIDWFTIDGGGGSSGGGAYTLTGTIGQPDAGTMTGGSFVLEGGFWPGVFAVQQGGAPRLFIQNSGANVIITWAPDSPGFILQHSPSFAPPLWGNVPDGANGISIPRSATQRFYRLRRD
ncbi:MAG: hypothetical protein L0Y58_14170 [Verrucomicrobia subdivision 3 bacterium]|nr:hypothetical protein [Limisphaerales bacterium]